ncbi:MAG: HIT family protein [Sedimentisphaerales bacterium]|jgi:histidine triad (HIT) family protein
MSAQECIFCKIASGQIPAVKIYEDEIIVAFLDIGPISDGHTLVLPRQHFEKVHNCPPELLGQIWTRLGRIANAVALATGADGYNVLCNNGRAAGQIVDHLHFHIVPRKTGDGVFAKWPSYKYGQGRAEAIAEKIIKLL